MFFHYSQNNSGGSFTGPAHHVIVEATSAERADSIAEYNGIYFDGCDTGQDCDCCGNRWSRAWPNDGETEPRIYDKVLTNDYALGYGLESAIVYYLDGKVAKFGKDCK